MNIVNIQQNVKLSVPIAEHEYIGPKNLCNFRNGDGEEKWWQEKWRQKYTGQFFQDCLHNIGKYEWENNHENTKHVYEGKFFANNLEGYSILSYPDGKTFEGLFKTNKRYGPGILTHPNGTQDVGLWDGTNLIRLNQITNENSVPNLSGTNQGKAYLLNYKKLVPVQKKLESKADEILSSLSSDESTLQNSDLLYSKFVRNTSSLFFNQKHYEELYFQDNTDWTIDIIDSFEDNGSPILKQVLVTELLAWNNESLAIDIMKHAFLHRNYEKLICYNISDVLTGQRYLFRSPGPQETYCLEFLNSCSRNEDSNVIRLICSYNLYPDVSDCRGNNGVFYSASNDQIDVIKVLNNFGANLDHLNDECLTPLSLSILRYIASKFDVINWELAFLPSNYPEINFLNIQQWRESIEKVTKNSLLMEQKYIFDLKCVKPPLNNKFSKVKKKKTPKKDKPKKSSKGKKRKAATETETKIQEESDEKMKLLEKIVQTIICLLECGSNPNLDTAPFPPLILSLFTNSNDILLNLIKYKADVNLQTSYHIGSLTPLHIIASLPLKKELISMATVLLNNNANVNKTANIHHWTEEKHIILSGTEVEDIGKTPLELLSMRYDFEEDPGDFFGELSSLFIKFGADLTRLYLGHSCLSLAILRGNIKLMRQLLKSRKVNPNQSLSNGMGVPLTVLILKRYEGILPVNICEKIYNCLIEYYANPLNTIPGIDKNTIEFSLDENNSKETTSKDKKHKKTSHHKVIQLLKKAANTTLLKHIKTKVVQIIYDYKIQCNFENEIFDKIVKFISNTVEATNILQILLDEDKIIKNELYCVNLLKLIETKVKNKPGKKKKSVVQLTIEEMVKNLDFDNHKSRRKSFSFEIFMPEIDPDEDKYKVCFECFQKTNKELILCPSCNLVYFCSQKCNTANTKNRNTLHPCHFIFYDSRKKYLQELADRGELIGDNILMRFEKMRGDENYLNLMQCEEKQSDEKSRRKNEQISSKNSSKTRSSPKSTEYKEKGKKKRDTSDTSEENLGKGKKKLKKKGRDKSDVSDTSLSKDKKKQKKKGRVTSETSDESINKKTKKKSNKKKRDSSNTSNESLGKGNKKQKKKQRDKSETSEESIRKPKRKPKKESRDHSEKSDKFSKMDKEQKRKKKDSEKIDDERTKKGKTKKTRDTSKSTDKSLQNRRKEKLSTIADKKLKQKEKKNKEKSSEQTKTREHREKSPYKKDKPLEHISENMFPQKMKSSEEYYTKTEKETRLKEVPIYPETRAYTPNIFEMFDYRFFQMFIPYCVFHDGQLYYKFNNEDVFQKLTYSQI